jgi:TRAP-type C4-dicarboxylate transport system substrate-binding protein
MTVTWHRAAAAVLLVPLIAAAGCKAGAASDRAGGAAVELTLSTIDDVNGNGQAYGPQAFVDALAKVSGGRIHVTVQKEYGDGAPDAESRMVKAIASGDVDGGWPSTRAFAAAGIAGLEPVEAPMTIASYAAEKDLVRSPVAASLLGRLGGSGVVGLGLAVGPLRRPFAAKQSLRAPADWAGASFRVYNSPTEAAAVTALGGKPVNLGFEWIDEIRAGHLRGAEFDIAQYATNGLSTDAGHVTANVVLWPKMYVLSLSKKKLDALTAEQRQWVRDAAQQAVAASAAATYDEAGLARGLCGHGTRFVDADPDQVAALRTAFAGVRTRLAANPLMSPIAAIGAAHPDPEPLNVPVDCRADVAPTSAVGPVPPAVSALPDGVYRVELTAADVDRAGGDPANTHPAGVWTLRVAGGQYDVRCRPLDKPGDDCGTSVSDKPLDVGNLRGTGNVVYFVYDEQRMARVTGCQLPVSSSKPEACSPNGTHRATWRIAGHQLIFSNHVSSFIDPLWAAKPWQKIG